MARKRPGVPFAKGQRLCIFCGRPGLSKTHIWPKWLNELLAPPTNHQVQLEAPPHSRHETQSKIKQGSIFSQKPYLACEKCNTGWMADFEDEMAKFAPPLFSASGTALRLTISQQRVLAGWIALIAILAEQIDKTKSSLMIPSRDISYLMKHRAPPPDWSIVCAGLSGEKWRARYRHKTTFIGQFTNLAEYWATVRRGVDGNTQLSSFGVGKIFFQVFTCPDPRFIADFRRCAEDAKLSQVWPIRASIFAHRTLKFPMDLVLTDEMADIIADAYMERIKELSAVSI